jgi:hypothetical protein
MIPNARPRCTARRRGRLTALLIGLVHLAAGTPAAVAAEATAKQATVGLPVATCPNALPADTTCYSGQQPSGAWYWIAIPGDWDSTLVLHAHGGPDLGAADPERSREDLERWSVMVREGHAWAGSSYLRGGDGTRMAATDTEQLHHFFDDAFGEPETTLLHGQS